MPRKARLPKAVLNVPVPDFVEHWLNTGERSWEFWLRARDEEALWQLHADRKVREMAQDEPGSRPLLWWKFNGYQRERLGGIGTPIPECSNMVPCFMYGVPEMWKQLDDTYLSRGVPLSDTDPPVYESEAAFLKRNKLLLRGEVSRIDAEDFKPVYVRRIDDEHIGLFRS